MKKGIIVILFCLLYSAIAVMAFNWIWQENQALQVKFKVPQDWKLSSEGNRISAQNPNEEAGLILLGAQNVNSLESLSILIRNFIPNMDLNKNERWFEMNGMDCFDISGAGEKNGRDIVLQIQSCENKTSWVVSVVWCYARKLSEYESILTTILKSFTPI